VATTSPPPAPSPVPLRTAATPLTAEKEFRLKAGQLIDLVPRLAAYVFTTTPTWPDIVNAAGGPLRHELGVSPSLWGEACITMGREQAALALAIVSTKAAAHFTRGAAGYFAGMMRKAARGELHLERSLWALREAKWGKADKRRRQ
jgi:replication initiation protein RepC